MAIGLDDPARAFLTRQPVGVLTTLRPDGKARSTLVYFALDGDRVHVSTESKRGKARDVERTGWASLCVVGHEKPFPSLTLEGAARLRRRDMGGPTAAVLAKIRGERPPADPTDEQLAAADRVVLEIAVERVYGASYLD
jgi:PPOX class probable F420-dependent enzyme